MENHSIKDYAVLKPPKDDPLARSKLVLVAKNRCTHPHPQDSYSIMHRKMKLPDEFFEVRTKPVVANFICKTHPHGIYYKT
jgi:hypothetical protein